MKCYKHSVNIYICLDKQIIYDAYTFLVLFNKIVHSLIIMIKI